jgi:hypothetical protein
MRRLARLWRSHRALVVAFALALALTLVFAARALVFAVYWADPAHRDRAIEGWMTPRYIAHSWDLPPATVGAALGLAPGAGRADGARLTLEEIAEARGTSVAALAAAIEAAAAAHRAPQ